MNVIIVIVEWCALQRLVSCFDCSESIYINSSADATAIAQKCPILQQYLFIEPSVAGAISLDGLEQIGVSLIFNDDNLITSVSSNSLQSTGYWFQFLNLSSLVTLSFPNLKVIGQALDIEDTPALETLQLANGVSIGANYDGYNQLVNVTNTGLAEIEGWMNATSTYDIWIAHNRNLRTVNLLVDQILPYPAGTSGASDTGGSLFIMNNGQSVNVSLPNLFTIGNTLTIGDCSELSIPSLSRINGSMEMIDAGFSSLSASSLVRIQGNLNITGAFSNISFPVLTQVGGNIFIQSSEVLDCAPLKNLYISNNLEGEFYCEGAPIPSPSHNSTSSPSGLSAGAKGGIIAGSVVAAILVVSTAAFIILKRRRNVVMPPTTGMQVQDESKDPKLAELGQDEYQNRPELPATPNQVSELHGDPC